MKKLSALLIAFSVGVLSLPVLAQTCTSNPTTITATPINLSNVTWSGTGGMTPAGCAAIANGSDLTTTANFVIDLANAVALTIDNSITIHGNFKITNSGNSSVTVSNTVHVTGNMGDPTNNNCNYIINGSLTVDGTFSGKNTNQFSGSGSISGGTFSFGNANTCGATCPTCSPAGSAFCSQWNTALPVLLTSFDASANPKGVALKWATASEINFDYFSLQRSNNGTAFNEIAQVRSHGTTNVQHSYSYEDNDPFIGRSYYRLTSNDFDGYQETFKVVSIEYHGEKNFHVSPNPSDGSSVKLNFNFETDADGLITVYDNMGSVIGSYLLGTGSISFESNLKSGVYLAKYTSASFSKTERFMVK